jgi:hypothetical protein
MSTSQTQDDYKSYFYNKFIGLFKGLVNSLIQKISNNDEKKDLEKIAGLMEKLNYDKIIVKLATNNKLMEVLLFLNKNKFSQDVCSKYLNSNEKYWSLMPSFNINKILVSLDENGKSYLQEQLNNLHVCAVTYSKVIEQLESCKDGENFNPFETVGKVDENMDINTLFNGVEVKNISAYEMLMESIINQQMDSKMTDYMSNIKENDVNEAAEKLNDVLNSDKFSSNKQTTKILSDMLSNIKNEVISLKSIETDKLQGKQGVEQLLGIAQKVAGNMMGTIKDSNVSVLDIWDATSNLAKNTVQSDALNIVDGLIRSNIEQNMKRAQGIDPNLHANSNTNSNTNTNTNNNTNTNTNTNAINTIFTDTSSVDDRKKRRDKRKESKK